MNRSTSLLTILITVLMLTGCGQTYIGVPPNYIGMMLTPTGYEEKIYTPGQADVGTKDSNGMGNSLILIQRSGLQVKEAFGGREANADKEDHRCLTGDKLPMTIDVRLLLALPDYQTKQGKEDLKSLFLLGNPKAQPENERVLIIDAEQVYKDQTQLEIRARIRQVCQKLPNFAAAFKAFGETGDDSLSYQIRKEVVAALKLKGVPLGVISIEVSNLKPDQSVTDALVQQASSKEQQKTINDMAVFLAVDPARMAIYRIQVEREIAMAAISRGNSSLIVYGNGGNGGVLPLPRAVTSPQQSAPERENQPKK